MDASTVVTDIRRGKPKSSGEKTPPPSTRERKLDAAQAWILDAMSAGSVLSSETAQAAGFTKGTYYLARRRLKQMGALAKKHGVTKPASSRGTVGKTAIVRATRKPPPPPSADETLVDLFQRLRAEYGVLELHYQDGELTVKRRVRIS